MAASQSSQDRPGIRFERDAKGRIVRRIIDFGGGGETRSYAYDAKGRLARVTDGSGALCESYQYDHEGRRLAEINPARFRGERRYVYAAGNRLSQAGRAQYRHDAAGYRCLKDEGGRETRYEYEPSGLLLAVKLPGGQRIEYVYGAAGQRVEKRVDGRIAEAYRWRDPLRLLDFFDGREWWRLAYDQQRPGRAPVGVTNGRESYLIHSDHLDTPLALANLDGGIVQMMRYDSFGNALGGHHRAVRLPIGFAGGLHDADTGLTRFVWRDYDADTGRFTALDPLGENGGDPDWYGYCVDDPVNRVDAWGLEGEKATPYFCRWTECDDKGTIQGDYKPIEGRKDSLPFLLDSSVPVPKQITDWLQIGDPSDPKETRAPVMFDPIVDPFLKYFEETQKTRE